MEGFEALERKVVVLERTVEQLRKLVFGLAGVLVVAGGLWALSSLTGRPSLRVSSVEVVGPGGRTIARIGESPDHEGGALTALSNDGKSQFQATAAGYGLSAPSALR